MNKKETPQNSNFNPSKVLKKTYVKGFVGSFKTLRALWKLKSIETGFVLKNNNTLCFSEN